LSMIKSIMEKLKQPGKQELWAFFLFYCKLFFLNINFQVVILHAIYLFFI
jgi:hypothetical protein